MILKKITLLKPKILWIWSLIPKYQLVNILIQGKVHCPEDKPIGQVQVVVNGKCIGQSDNKGNFFIQSQIQISETDEGTLFKFFNDNYAFYDRIFNIRPGQKVLNVDVTLLELTKFNVKIQQDKEFNLPITDIGAEINIKPNTFEKENVNLLFGFLYADNQCELEAFSGNFKGRTLSNEIVYLESYNAFEITFKDSNNRFLINKQPINIKIPVSDNYSDGASIWKYDPSAQLWIDLGPIGFYSKPAPNAAYYQFSIPAYSGSGWYNVDKPMNTNIVSGVYYEDGNPSPFSSINLFGSNYNSIGFATTDQNGHYKVRLNTRLDSKYKFQAFTGAENKRIRLPTEYTVHQISNQVINYSYTDQVPISHVWVSSSKKYKQNLNILKHQAKSEIYLQAKPVLHTVQKNQKLKKKVFISKQVENDTDIQHAAFLTTKQLFKNKFKNIKNIKKGVCQGKGQVIFSDNSSGIITIYDKPIPKYIICNEEKEIICEGDDPTVIQAFIDTNEQQNVQMHFLKEGMTPIVSQKQKIKKYQQQIEQPQKLEIIEEDKNEIINEQNDIKTDEDMTAILNSQRSKNNANKEIINANPIEEEKEDAQNLLFISEDGETKDIKTLDNQTINQVSNNLLNNNEQNLPTLLRVLNLTGQMDDSSLQQYYNENIDWEDQKKKVQNHIQNQYDARDVLLQDDLIEMLNLMEDKEVKVQLLEKIGGNLAEPIKESQEVIIEKAFQNVQKKEEQQIEIIQKMENIKQINPIFGNVQSEYNTFCVDISGSMNLGFTSLDGKEYTRLDSVKIQLKQIISGLNSSQYFNIYAFNDELHCWNTSSWKCVQATPENIKNAIEWIDKLEAENQTNLSNAIYKAIDEEPRLNTIHLLSDGAPTESKHKLYGEYDGQVIADQLKQKNQQRQAQVIPLPPVKINTIGFFMVSPEQLQTCKDAINQDIIMGKQILKLIAEATYGNFKIIEKVQ